MRCIVYQVRLPNPKVYLLHIVSTMWEHVNSVCLPVCLCIIALCLDVNSPLSESIQAFVVVVSFLYGTHPPLLQFWVAPAGYWWLWMFQCVQILHCSEPRLGEYQSFSATFEPVPPDQWDQCQHLEYPPLATLSTETASLEEMNHPVIQCVCLYVVKLYVLVHVRTCTIL